VASDGLSGEQREAVRMRVLEERSYDVVSRELGITETAARARVSRGLRALRRAMASDREES
jgi:DNA-directed RNA polymerase specialized sigma24 family protein